MLHLPHLTVLVNGEGHIRGDDLIAANLTELEGTVSIHCIHLQDAVVRFALDDRSLVRLLLEYGWVLIHVVHLDMNGCPGGEQKVSAKWTAARRKQGYQWCRIYWQMIDNWLGLSKEAMLSHQFYYCTQLITCLEQVWKQRQADRDKYWGIHASVCVNLWKTFTWSNFDIF